MQILNETSAANHNQAMWYRSYCHLPTRVPLSGNRTDRLTVPILGETTDRLIVTIPRDDVKCDLAITDEPQGHHHYSRFHISLLVPIYLMMPINCQCSRCTGHKIYLVCRDSLTNGILFTNMAFF